MSDQSLQGQVAVVAGATRGTGRGIARMRGAAGATVSRFAAGSTRPSSTRPRPEEAARLRGGLAKHELAEEPAIEWK